MANDTYPTDPALTRASSSTAVNATNWNYLLDNIEAIADDLIGAVSDTQTFAGTDHTAAQNTDIQDMLESIRHMIAELSGKTNWYDAPDCGLADLYTRFVELHPPYLPYIETTSLRGAAADGNNTITVSTGQVVASNTGRNYIEGTSSETSLQNTYLAVKFTIPDIFDAWATSNAIQIDFVSESGVSINCHLDVHIYKAGTEAEVANSTANANTSWTTISIDDSSLGSWSAGDVMEMYLKLESRNDYYVRVGKIKFNFTV